MTATIVAVAFGFLLVAAVIGVGWWQVYERGKDDQQAKQLKEQNREKDKIIDSLKAHPLSLDEQLATLNRLRKRLASRRKS